MSKKESEKSTKSSEPDDHGPETGPKDLAQMSDVRANIVKKAAAKRRTQVEEVNMDDDSAAVLEQAQQGVSPSDDSEEARRLAEHIAKEGGDDEPERESRSDARGTQREDNDAVADEMQTVVIYGREYKVPTRDIEAAGGLKAYQTSRAANIRFAEAATLRKKVAREQQELERRKQELDQRAKELEQQQTARTSSEDDEPPNQGAHENREDRETKVKSIVKRIYGGNEEEAAKAIEDILDSVDHRPALSAQEVADMVLSRLKEEQEQSQRSAKDEAAEADQIRREEERKQVNHLMRTEFDDVMADPILKDFALVQYRKRMADPNNVGRDAVDIAREAGLAARRVSISDPERELESRRREKRDKPPETSARRTAEPEQERKPPSTKAHIERLRKRAGQQVHSGG